jgi:hypothetical protein
MTPDQLNEALRILGWSTRELARRVGCSPETSRRWTIGQLPVPPDIAVWVAACRDAMAPALQAIAALKVPPSFRQQAA